MSEKERSNDAVKEEDLDSVTVTDASVDVELAAALLQVKKLSHDIELGQQPLELTRSNHHLDIIVSQRDAALRSLTREKCEHRRAIENLLAAIEPPSPSTTSFSRQLKGEEGDSGKEVTAPVGDHEREGARYTEKGEEEVEMSGDQVLLQRIRSMLRDILAECKTATDTTMDIASMGDTFHAAAASHSSDKNSATMGENLESLLTLDAKKGHQEESDQWKQLDDLPPPQAPDTSSPIIQNALDLWLNNSKREMFQLDHVLSGGAVDHPNGYFVPRVQVSGLSDNTRDAFIHTILPLLLRRKGIEVEVYECCNVVSSFDLRVKVFPSSVIGKHKRILPYQDRIHAFATRIAHGDTHIEESWMDTIPGVANGLKMGITEGMRAMLRLEESQEETNEVEEDQQLDARKGRNCELLDNNDANQCCSDVQN